MENLILIPDRLKGNIEIEKNILSKKFKVIHSNSKTISQVKNKYLSECYGILAWHDISYPEVNLNKLKNCKVISRVGVGYDSIDLKYAGKKGIYVFNVPDYGVEEVADHALSMILNLTRLLSKTDQILKKNIKKWHWSLLDGNIRFKNLTCGILGLGRIGSAVAMRLKAFGCKVIFYDKYLKPGIEKSLGIARVDSAEELISSSNIVTVHLPSTNETKKILNKKLFANFKKDSFLINVSRGDLIDESELVKSINKKNLIGVALDVLEKEPPTNSELIKLWKSGQNIILSPHAAFYSKESYIEMRVKAAKNILNFFTKKDLTNCVNLDYIV